MVTRRPFFLRDGATLGFSGDGLLHVAFSQQALEVVAVDHLLDEVGLRVLLVGGVSELAGQRPIGIVLIINRAIFRTPDRFLIRYQT